MSSALLVTFVAIENTELGTLVRGELVEAVRVGEHVEGVNEVELLEADLRQVEVTTSNVSLLLLDLKELKELLIPNTCLPGFHHAVVHCDKE